MFTQTTVKLGMGLIAYPNNDTKIDPLYQRMIDFLDLALHKLEEVLKEADDARVDQRIAFDLQSLYNMIYTLYDKYENLDYNKEAKTNDQS